MFRYRLESGDEQDGLNAAPPYEVKNLLDERDHRLHQVRRQIHTGQNQSKINPARNVAVAAFSDLFRHDVGIEDFQHHAGGYDDREEKDRPGEQPPAELLVEDHRQHQAEDHGQGQGVKKRLDRFPKVLFIRRILFEKISVIFQPDEVE